MASVKGREGGDFAERRHIHRFVLTKTELRGKTSPWGRGKRELSSDEGGRRGPPLQITLGRHLPTIGLP
jgi:hypothetical protein